MKCFLSIANRHLLHTLWGFALLAAVYLLVAHRPGALPNKGPTTSINNWLVETTPLLSLLRQLERDLSTGSMPLRQGIDIAEHCVDDTLLKKALCDFGGDTLREKVSNMLILWVVDRDELEPTPEAKAQLESLRKQHLQMFPHSPVPPVSKG